MEPEYVVKFKRADGTEAYLGPAGTGPQDLEGAGRCTREEADEYAAERNHFYPRTKY